MLRPHHSENLFFVLLYLSAGFNLKNPLKRANPNHWTSFHPHTKGGPNFLYGYFPLYNHWPLFISTSLAVFIAPIIFLRFIFANFSF
jgi:hypothetical protein